MMLFMEGGDQVTVICVDTSITNRCWFLDQINAVELYYQHKVKDQPNHRIGIVTSTKLDYGAKLDHTCSLASLIYSYNSLEGHVQDYTCLREELTLLGLFDAESKKRLLVFSGSSLLSTRPRLSTSGEFPQDIASLLKRNHVVLDVVHFGPSFKDKEDPKERNLKALIYYMNFFNKVENESSRYFRFDDDRFSLSQCISRLLLTEDGGKVTVICVDTSITSLAQFYDQIHAVEIYCRRLLEDPHRFVSIARFGQRDLGISLYPTNCLETVTSILSGLNPLKQEYTDLLQGFDDLLKGLDSYWFDQERMIERIVVFSGSPLLSTPELKKNAADLLKKRHVVLDVFAFGTALNDKEGFREKYLKTLVDSVNDDNERNQSSHYFPIPDDGFSLSHHMSCSLILPPAAEEKEEEKEKEEEEEEEAPFGLTDPSLL